MSTVPHISDEVLERYNVKREDLETLHNQWKLFGRMINMTKKSKVDPELSKRTYYCEVCSKNVRVFNRDQHNRTKLHTRLSRD